MRHSAAALASVILAVSVFGCASPLAPPTLMPAETAVALTLQAIVAAATPLPSDTAAPLPTAVPNILPRKLYFRNRDGAGIMQLFSLGVDGTTVTQVTFEPLNVDAYDVAPIDGSIAFVSNNQLYLVDAAGAGRRLLIDGGPIDPANPWANSISAPAWSPDGRTLAYGHGGLNLMEPATAVVNRVLQNQIDTSAGFAIVKEIYAPAAYSADGTRLLITIGYYESGTFGIYHPSNNALVRFQREDGGIVCCRVSWLPDGSGAYIASSTIGMFESGLYHADAATGAVTPLLPGAAPDGTYNFADAAEVGPDNRLYFLFNNLSQIPNDDHTPLYIVRSAPDGSTDRTQLLPDAFENINEVLWAPDASVLILAIAAGPDAYAGGEARLIYLDGRPSMALLPVAEDLRWGQ